MTEVPEQPAAQSAPAMTMREIRQALGHNVAPTAPAPLPADRLREAAAVVQNRAAIAAEAVAALPFGAEHGYSAVMDSWLGHGSGALAALMSPAVGEALAAWLESVADRLEETTHPGWQAVVVDPRALAAADQILAAVSR